MAGIELAGRSGAYHVEFGYLDEDVPIREARWWATATYKGAKLTEENHQGPAEAVEALALRILRGGLCTGCQRIMFDECKWYRKGPHWVRGCDGKAGLTRQMPNRAERRRSAHRRRR